MILKSANSRSRSRCAFRSPRPRSGSQGGPRRWLVDGRDSAAARGQFVFIAIAFGCLTYAFVANDFTVVYVASNSNSALPLATRLGVWGGHEGSMLLWILMLSVWTVGVTLFSRTARGDGGRVLG